jgi:hypothetical protein
MVRVPLIMLLLPFAVGVYVPPCWPMEVELLELPSQDQSLRTAMTKVAKGVLPGGRISRKAVAKQFTTPLVRAKGSLGAGTLSTPLRIKVSVSGIPVTSPGNLGLEPLVEVKAAKAAPRSLPGELELSVTSRPQNDNSLVILYRFSF